MRVVKVSLGITKPEVTEIVPIIARSDDSLFNGLLSSLRLAFNASPKSQKVELENKIRDINFVLGSLISVPVQEYDLENQRDFAVFYPELSQNLARFSQGLIPKKIEDYDEVIDSISNY